MTRLEPAARLTHRMKVQGGCELRGGKMHVPDRLPDPIIPPETDGDKRPVPPLHCTLVSRWPSFPKTGCPGAERLFDRRYRASSRTPARWKPLHPAANTRMGPTSSGRAGPAGISRFTRAAGRLVVPPISLPRFAPRYWFDGRDDRSA